MTVGDAMYALGLPALLIAICVLDTWARGRK